MESLNRLRLLLVLFPIFCVANPDAQQYTNNAPFSGAIYIVNPNGQEVNAAGANVCPSYASASCSNIGHPSWCCPSNYTCASPPNSGGLIGCCPNGSSCGGTVNVAAVTTVTVQYAQQTSVVYVQSQPTTAVVYAQSTEVVYQGGFCSTLTMDGPGLPTTREGACGTILVVNEGASRAFSYGLGIFVVVFHLALGRMFGFGR
ncbi:hypothetical protein K469DRAFT_549716 [Zopfia rhizophila CBS 207.26]|uniref:Uncharacterized protein n=1 Tax=Zopfia rhizophila CBS 207.26 TaxID=1314779 RepID=A0A6A6ETN4_9PEZI|nr:hypothetical protein K469DRAFT_549716 [Zopfia rhizophila CBS 207.26]